MRKLKLVLNCINCGEDEIDDDSVFDGCCPNCHEHHGEVSYYSELSADEFVQVISEYSERDIVNFAEAINIAAKYIAENL